MILLTSKRLSITNLVKTSTTAAVLIVLGLAGLMAKTTFAQTSAPATGAAGNYPVRPIKLVVPFPPGGATDILGRALAQKLGASLGQTVIIENKPGAGGTIGADSVAKATADGYTFLVATSSTHSIGPAINAKIPYDAFKDFEPVAHFANAPSVLVVGQAFPAKTAPELVSLLKSQPGKYNFGSSGIGTYPHLMAELFKWRAGGLFVVHIPYRGTGLVITDLVSGQIGFLMDSIVSAQPHVRDGKVKALAVSGTKRSTSMPTVPTFTEAGIPGLELSNWFGVFAPAGTPKAIIERMNREINQAVRQADFIERLERAGADPVTGTPEQFSKVYRDEFEGWKAVIKRANIKPE
jgi:tripartite-type tricarboxylate transporter receptor subunit TctC